MVRKTKKKAKGKKVLENLKKAVKDIKNKSLKEDVKNLMQDDFSFQGKGDFDFSFPFSDTDFDVERPVTRQTRTARLESTVALEPDERKKEKEDFKYTSQNNNYRESKQQEDETKYAAIKEYNEMQGSSEADYVKHAAPTAQPAKERQDIGNIAALSELEARNPNDVLTQNVIGKDVTGKDYKIGKQGKLHKKEYSRQYE